MIVMRGKDEELAILDNYGVVIAYLCTTYTRGRLMNTEQEEEIINRLIEIEEKVEYIYKMLIDTLLALGIEIEFRADFDA